MPVTPTSDISLALFGCGHWGPNHVRVFNSLPGCSVLAVADTDERRLRQVQSNFPEIEAESDYRRLLARTDVTAVVVALPTKLHFGVVKDALNAGKHVFCEKPLCLTSAEAEELVSLAEERSLILMVGHVFLFNSGIVELKRLIDQGTIGTPRILRATRTNLGPVRTDVNSVYDLASHDISIFNWLLGSLPESVSAVGASFLNPGIEDVAFLTLNYPRGAIANIQVSWLDPKKLREIVVVGDHKMIVWDELSASGPLAIYDKGFDRPPDYADFGAFQMLAREGDLTIPKIRLEEPLKTQNRFFADAVRTGRLEFNDGKFAVGVIRVLEATAESLKRGGTPVMISNPSNP